MAVKSIYTKELGRELAMMAKGVPGHYLVIPMPKNKWAVVADGRSKPTRVFRMKEEAVAFAKIVAQAKGGEVAVLDRNGEVAKQILF